MTNHLGHDVSFETFKGKVLLIVNTATKCGLTPQYDELQQLYDKYKNQGFVVLDFPCNQFRNQAPEPTSEIVQTCKTKFGVEFPVFEKIEVNGPNEAPLYTFLKEQQPKDDGGSTFKDFLLKLASIGESREEGDIQWNFTKFLVDREGRVVGRFAPSEKPSELTGEIEKLL